MAVHRDLPRTLLPITRWAEILGIDPLHFHQVTYTDHAVQTCTKVWKQYSWQEADQIGRYDVAHAIQQAERQISQYLGYKLLPVWEYAERHNTPRPANPELLYRSFRDPSGYNLAVQADWGKFVEAGVETKSVIEAGVAITYSDEDGDGFDETATISFTTTVTDEDEIAVFYPDESGADEWEIRPLYSVCISGGTCTVQFWRVQCVDPDLIEAMNPEAVDGDTDANFLTTVDVYRRYNDPETQATLVWNPNLFNCSACTDSDTTCCPVCGQTTQTACLSPKDYDRGWLMYRPASYDDGTWTTECLTCARNPDQVIMYYRAGLQDRKKDRPTVEMDNQWERAVALLALTLLDRQVCDCNAVRNLTSYWTEDMGRQSPGGGSFQVTERNLDNPFGTTRAAIKVWNMIKEPGRVLASPVKY